MTVVARRAAGRLLPRYTTHRPSVVAIVLIRRVQFTGIVIQVERVRRRANRTRPVVPVRTEIVERRAIQIARANEPQQAVFVSFCYLTSLLGVWVVLDFAEAE